METIAKVLSSIVTPENAIRLAAYLMGLALKNAELSPEQRTIILSEAETLLAKTSELVKEIRRQNGMAVSSDFPKVK